MNPSVTPVFDFQCPAIQHNMRRLVNFLSVHDLARLETACATVGLFEVAYEHVQKRFFPKCIRPEGVSAKQFFKETTQRILYKIKEKHGLTFSAHTFFNAAQGKVEDLLQSGQKFSLAAEKWLWAIQYVFDAPVFPKDSTLVPVVAYYAAELFATIQNYTALEQLYEQYYDLFIGWVDLKEPYDFYVVHGHLEKVQLLLQEPMPEEVLMKMLWSAAHHEHCDLVELLLAHAQIPRGRALLEAARRGYSAVVDFLLMRAEDAEISVEEKGGAFQKAFSKKHCKVIEVLLDRAGAEIAVAEKAKVLTWACGKLNPTMVGRLLELTEAELSLACKEEAFLEAVQWGNVHVVEFLLTSLGDAITANIKEIALQYAARDACAASVLVLLLKNGQEQIGVEAKKRAIKHAVDSKRPVALGILLEDIQQEHFSPDEKEALVQHVVQGVAFQKGIVHAYDAGCLSTHRLSSTLQSALEKIGGEAKAKAKGCF